MAKLACPKYANRPVAGRSLRQLPLSARRPRLLIDLFARGPACRPTKHAQKADALRSLSHHRTQPLGRWAAGSLCQSGKLTEVPSGPMPTMSRPVVKVASRNRRVPITQVSQQQRCLILIIRSEPLRTEWFPGRDDGSHGALDPRSRLETHHGCGPQETMAGVAGLALNLDGGGVRDKYIAVFGLKNGRRAGAKDASDLLGRTDLWSNVPDTRRPVSTGSNYASAVGAEGSMDDALIMACEFCQRAARFPCPRCALSCPNRRRWL